MTPPTMHSQEPDKTPDSLPAMRSASPTLRIAVPMTKPLSTSQNADDRNPENTTSAGAMLRIIAAVKNSSAVRNSGRIAVAQSRIVAVVSSAGSSKPAFPS